jgi:hypothetical protein
LPMDSHVKVSSLHLRHATLIATPLVLINASWQHLTASRRGRSALATSPNFP